MTSVIDFDPASPQISLGKARMGEGQKVFMLDLVGIVTLLADVR